MDRLAAGLAAALAVAAAGVVTVAGAQTLATLHVRSFAIAADRTTVTVGEAFHVTMTAHVDEPVAELDNVTLPDLAAFDVYGDERRCTASPRGSDCSETLTLAGRASGDHTIGPWTMEAIDAGTRRPSRFASNTVLVRVVAGSPLRALSSVLPALVSLAVLACLSIAVTVLAFRAIVRSAARDKPAALAAAEPVAPAAQPDPPPRPQLSDLVDALARDPTRARAVAVREALRAQVGAGEDETLADLIARGAVANDKTLAALRAIERATFCEDARVEDAVREALPFLTR